MVDGQYQPLDEADLKKQLYNWATKPSGEGGLRVPAGEEDKEKYIYNTIAPGELPATGNTDLFYVIFLFQI